VHLVGAKKDLLGISARPLLARYFRATRSAQTLQEPAHRGCTACEVRAKMLRCGFQHSEEISTAAGKGASQLRTGDVNQQQRFGFSNKELEVEIASSIHRRESSTKDPVWRPLCWSQRQLIFLTQHLQQAASSSAEQKR
jgi:hypothetical protein